MGSIDVKCKILLSLIILFVFILQLLKNIVSKLLFIVELRTALTRNFLIIFLIIPFFNLLGFGLSLKFPEMRFSGKFSIVSPAYGEQKIPFHLRLVNRLDRPEDGYCLDILGTPNNMRINLPLFAHNCKSTLTPDSAVIFNPSGQIKFISVNRCITVAGVNSNAVPGASILLRKCDEILPFFETSALQRFIHRKDGRISIISSDLCLTVGTESAETYSPYHRWRALFVEDCNNADASRSKWEFIIPE